MDTTTNETSASNVTEVDIEGRDESKTDTQNVKFTSNVTHNGRNEPELTSREGSLSSRRVRDKSAVGNFLSINFNGSLEAGYFQDVNDVYIKYSIVAGPDWMIGAGTDLGITQIARFKIHQDSRRWFVWNQPISVCYRSYNFFGWPQIVLSVYYFDIFGKDQVLGYGCAHLPVTGSSASSPKQVVKIYSPQSTSFLKRIVSWITGKKPELVETNLFARGDLRSSLQMVYVGQIELSLYLTTKDVSKNSYRAHSRN